MLGKKKGGGGGGRTEREISEQSKCGTLIGPFRKLNPGVAATREIEIEHGSLEQMHMG